MKKTCIKTFTFLVLFQLIFLQSRAQQTVFEKSDGNETATYFEIMAWYDALAKRSDKVLLKTMGPTDAGYPLHVLLMSEDRIFEPAQWHQQNKIVILINNGIHPGEPDGIDASMLLIRDIVDKKIILPQNIVLAFIPLYNIGGSLNRNSTTRVNQNGPEEYGFRGNAQNLDLNRDFTKADSREAASFAEIFHELDPHIFIDNHVSDGADFQHTMTLISTQYDKLGAGLGTFLKEKIEPEIYRRMAEKSWDLIPYVDFGNMDISEGMTMFYDPPRYSTGYAALFQTLAFMPETHMLKPYTQRVQSTYDLMESIIQIASKFAHEIRVQRTDARLSLLQQKSFALSWKADTVLYDEIEFKGYATDTAISKATGLPAMFYDREKPFHKNIRFYNVYRGNNFITAPSAYIIPQGWHAVVERLLQNKVKMHRLQNDSTITVGSYRIESYSSYNFPYEKHHKNYAVTVSKKQEQVKFLRGDYVVFTQQPAKRYIIEMLEPQAEDGFFSWNFFDAILQQKEGYSDYRWDSLAGEWLAKNESLQKKLSEKKAEDPAFAKNHRAILNFIYKHSPYYERAHLQYPVYRID